MRGNPNAKSLGQRRLAVKGPFMQKLATVLATAIWAALAALVVLGLFWPVVSKLWMHE